MFTPFTLRGITLKNRVVVSPMAQYSCVDGMPADYHLVHLGARAMGGAGMVVAEMTCPTPDARITPGCPGPVERGAARWLEAHRRFRPRSTAMRRSPCSSGTPAPRARPACRGKARTSRSCQGNWPLISASPQQYLDGVSDWSRAMTRADMDRVRDDFVRSTALAAQAGFDWLELHCAHGYLLVQLHLAADQPAHRRIRRLAGEPPALSAGSVPRHARGLARAPADVGAHLRARLGGRRHHAGRRRGDRPGLQGGGRRPDRLLLGPGQQAAKAGVRAHVPDAVRRPHPQRGRHRRPSRWARSRKPTTSTASSPPAAPTCARWRARTWPIRPGRCWRRPRSATWTFSGPSSTCPAKTQLERNLEREKATAAQALQPVDGDLS